METTSRFKSFFMGSTDYMLLSRAIQTQNRKGWHSKSAKGEYRLHYVVCRTNGSGTKLTKYKYRLTATTPNNSTMPSRQFMGL